LREKKVKNCPQNLRIAQIELIVKNKTYDAVISFLFQSKNYDDGSEIYNENKRLPAILKYLLLYKFTKNLFSHLCAA